MASILFMIGAEFSVTQKVVIFIKCIYIYKCTKLALNFPYFRQRMMEQNKLMREKNLPEVYKENVKLKKMLSHVVDNVHGCGDADNGGDVFEDVENIGRKNKSTSFKKRVNDFPLKHIFTVLFTISNLVIIGFLIFFFFFNTKSGKDLVDYAFSKTSFTVGKVDRRDLQDCHGSSLKRTFPSLDYALFGYNRIYGYPLASGHDPGLTHPIFVADYSRYKYSADCRFNVPVGYVVVPDVACVTSFTSETVKDSSQFEKSLSVSAEVGGGGWGVSFSASSEYKKKISVMASSESVFIFSTAKCNYYFAMMDEIYPPKLTNQFLTAAKEINTNGDLFRFFDYYGTDFLTYTLFGARFVYEHKMSKSNFQKETSEETSLAVKASYSGLFTMSGGFGMSSSQKAKAEKFRSKVETKTISIGAPPPSDGNTMTWAATVKDDPLPVAYKMKSIEELFTERFMRNTGVDYAKLNLMIQQNKKAYCEKLQVDGVVDSCKQFARVVKFRLYISGGKYYQFNYEQCEDKCVNDELCFAVHFDGSSNCYIYRKKGADNFVTENRMANNETKLTINMNLVNKHQESVAKESSKSYVTIFVDNMKLMDMVFKLTGARVKKNVVSRAMQNENKKYSEKECSHICLEDPMCTAYTHREQVDDGERNCWTYNTEKIIDNVVQSAMGYVTAFQLVDSQ